MKLVGVVAVVASLTIAASSAVVGSASASGKAPLPHGLGARAASTSVTSSVTFAPRAVPASVDLTKYTAPVGDQGQVGSCVTWAIDYAMMGVYAREQGRRNSQFAPMYAYSQIQAQAHRRDDGAYPSEAYNITRTQGVDTKSDYTQGPFNWQTLPNARERANAGYARTGGFSDLYANPGYPVGWPGYTRPFGENEKVAIQNALSQGRPVALSMAVLWSFFELDAQHPWLSADSEPGATNADVYGYHEVLIVGYDQRGVKIQNSWGTGWGQGGFGYLEWGYLARSYADPYQPAARDALITFELSVLNPFRFPALHATTLSENVAATTIRRGAPNLVTTSLRPVHPGTPVTLQYSSDNRSWRTLSTVKTNTASNAGWWVSTTVNRYYRVVYAGDPGWTPAHSRSVLVRVA